jgi:hypothetical protein
MPLFASEADPVYNPEPIERSLEPLKGIGLLPERLDFDTKSPPSTPDPIRMINIPPLGVIRPEPMSPLVLPSPSRVVPRNKKYTTRNKLVVMRTVNEPVCFIVATEETYADITAKIFPTRGFKRVSPITRGNEFEIMDWVEKETVARMLHCNIISVRGLLFPRKDLTNRERNKAVSLIKSWYPYEVSCQRCGSKYNHKSCDRYGKASFLRGYVLDEHDIFENPDARARVESP